MVLDTSACLDLVLDTSRGRAIRTLLLDEASPLLAPGVLWVEFARVLRSQVAAATLSRRRAEEALADFLDLGVEEVDVEPLVIRAWQLRDNITVDDGVFVALAEMTLQPLLTTDVRLARAVTEHTDAHVLTHLDADTG
jgi:predicted nucleic acid-binding protein